MAEATRKSHSSFKSFFRVELLPILARYERIRRLRLPLCVLMWIGHAALALTLFLAWINIDNPWLPWLLATAVLAIGFAMVFRLAFLPGQSSSVDAVNFAVLQVDRVRRAAFSEEVIARVADFAVPGIAWKHGGSIRQADFMESKLTHNFYNKFEGRDLFHFKRGSAWIALSWLKVEYVPKSRDDKNPYRLLHNGWFFKAVYPRRFQGQIFVHRDVAEAAMGWFGRSVQGFAVPDGLELIHLEDAEFEHRFTVHASGQLDARYLLSPGLMRSAVAVHKRLRGKMAFSFRYDTMYAAFPAVIEYFTSLPTKPFTDPAFTRHFYHALRGFCELVEDIDRNHRLWQDAVRE